MLKKIRMFEQVTDADAGAGQSPAETTPPVENDVDWNLLVADESVESESEVDGQVSVPEPQPEDDKAVEEVEQPEAPAEVEKPQESTQAPFTTEQVAEFRKAWLSDLESTYAINDDDAMVLQTEPEKVLPRMAANMHARIVEQVAQQMQQIVPTIVQNMQSASEREATAKSTFFTEWPELKQHEAQVLKTGMLFRQLNPNAPPDEVVNTVGSVVMAQLGIKRDAPAPTQQQRAFRPAAPGGTTAPATPPGEWDFLIDG